MKPYLVYAQLFVVLTLAPVVSAEVETRLFHITHKALNTAATWVDATPRALNNGSFPSYTVLAAPEFSVAADEYCIFQFWTVDGTILFDAGPTTTRTITFESLDPQPAIAQAIAWYWCTTKKSPPRGLLTVAAFDASLNEAITSSTENLHVLSTVPASWINSCTKTPCALGFLPESPLIINRSITATPEIKILPTQLGFEAMVKSRRIVEDVLSFSYWIVDGIKNDSPEISVSESNNLVIGVYGRKSKTVLWLDTQWNLFPREIPEICTRIHPVTPEDCCGGDLFTYCVLFFEDAGDIEIEFVNSVTNEVLTRARAHGGNRNKKTGILDAKTIRKAGSIDNVRLVFIPLTEGAEKRRGQIAIETIEIRREEKAKQR